MTGTEKDAGGETHHEDRADHYIHALLRDALKAAAEGEPPSEHPRVTIARVRRQLAEALQRRPNDIQHLVLGAEALLRAAAAKHKVEPADPRDFAEKAAAIIEELGQYILPPEPPREPHGDRNERSW